MVERTVETNEGVFKLLQEALDNAVRRLRNRPTAEATGELSALIEQAKAAGLRDDAPSMRRASALANLLYRAAAAVAKVSNT